jgi:hypothetical protein
MARDSPLEDGELEWGKSLYQNEESPNHLRDPVTVGVSVKPLGKLLVFGVGSLIQVA